MQRIIEPIFIGETSPIFATIELVHPLTDHQFKKITFNLEELTQTINYCRHYYAGYNIQIKQHCEKG